MIIKNERVTNQILAYVKEQITSGEWVLGQKVPSENQLAAELGISRASVRSAYQYLTGVGVLKSRQGSGTFLVDSQADGWDIAQNRITSEDCQDIHKVLEFRRILEPEACRMAAEHCTPEIFAELERCLKQMERGRGNPVKFVRADIEFHEAISRASGNSLLEKSLHKVFAETRNNHEQMNCLIGDYNGILYHTIILEALRKGDGQEAHDKMREHLEVTMRQVLAYEEKEAR